MNATTEFRPSDVDTLALGEGDNIGTDEAKCMLMTITDFLGDTDAPWSSEFHFENVAAWATDGDPNINQRYKDTIKARGEHFLISGFFMLVDSDHITRTDWNGVTYFMVTDKFIEAMRRFA